jgi:putative phage-type endonuclease
MDSTSTIIIRCTGCQQRLRVPVWIGEIRVNCPNCGFQRLMDTGERPSNPNSAGTYAETGRKVDMGERSFANPPPQFPYQVVDIQQGTSAWLSWRDQGIGASDAPTIMGENPWKSRGQLLDEKLRRVRVPANEAMARGTVLEPEARKRYELTTGISVRPVCLQSTKYYWLLASVDGLSDDGNSVVEIKCGNSVYKQAASSKQVPKYYYGQLQHILSVTGLSEIDFWCYLPERPKVHLQVERDDHYIARLLEIEQRFWDELRKLRE